MNNSGISSLFCYVIPLIIIVALVFLVRKTQEEEGRTNEEIQQIVRTLPSDQHTAFLVQYNAQRKNPATAVILALLLGSIGIHKFYLGQTGWGIVYLVLCWTFIPAIIAFFEAFTISQYVHQMNRQVATNAATLLRGGGAFVPTSR
jgi:TM2 domain-containing membrane protein YozV